MVVGGLLAKTAVGSEIARNGLIGTIKGVGEVLSGIRQGVITVVQDFQKMTGQWQEPKGKETKKQSKAKEEKPSGQ